MCGIFAAEEHLLLFKVTKRLYLGSHKVITICIKWLFLLLCCEKDTSKNKKGVKASWTKILCNESDSGFSFN